MSRGDARQELDEPVEFSEAKPITFRTAGYGVVCTGVGGCGALVGTNEQLRHLRWHRTLAAAIPSPRDDAD